MRNTLFVYTCWDRDDEVKTYVFHTLHQCRRMFKISVFVMNCLNMNE